jgi:hypothetical protein
MIYSLRRWHGWPVAVQWSPTKVLIHGLPVIGRRYYIRSRLTQMRGGDGQEDKGGVRGN